MAGTEGVVGALATLQEAGQAARLAQRLHAPAATSQHLVAVGLVADVPQDAVLGGLVDVVQRDGQLDGAEARGEVAAGLADALDQERAQLFGHLRQLRFGQVAQVARIVDRAEQGVACVGGHRQAVRSWTGNDAGLERSVQAMDSVRVWTQERFPATRVGAGLMVRLRGPLPHLLPSKVVGPISAQQMPLSG